MDALPTPQEGCFTSSYPKVEWRQTVCVTAPQLPYPPALGSGTDVVGNGNDVSGYVKNDISTAIGSFPKVTGVTSEKGDVNGSPPLVANTHAAAQYGFLRHQSLQRRIWLPGLAAVRLLDLRRRRLHAILADQLRGFQECEMPIRLVDDSSVGLLHQQLWP